jgi:hypothetical protein
MDSAIQLVQDKLDLIGRNPEMLRAYEKQNGTTSAGLMRHGGKDSGNEIRKQPGTSRL